MTRDKEIRLVEMGERDETSQVIMHTQNQTVAKDFVGMQNLPAADLGCKYCDGLEYE